MKTKLVINAKDFGAGIKAFTFSSEEDAAEAQKILIWLDPEPCVGSQIVSTKGVSR